MSGTIIIENLTGQHLQYRVEHQVVCVKFGKCFCKKGRRGSVTMTVHVPGGAGMRTEPLNPLLSKVPEIQRDVTGPKPKIKIVGSSAVSAKARAATKPTVKAEVETEVETEVEAAVRAKVDSTPSGKKGGGGRKGKNN